MQSQQIEDYESFEEARDTVKDMNANSAKLTYYVLEENGAEMGRDQLEEETMLPGRTLREAFNKLEDEGVAYRRNNPMNHAEKFYGLNVEEFEGGPLF